MRQSLANAILLRHVEGLNGRDHVSGLEDPVSRGSSFDARQRMQQYLFADRRPTPKTGHILNF